MISGDSLQNVKHGPDINAGRWKNIFALALRKVSSQVNPGFGIQPEALDYVEELIIRLLSTMIEKRPHTIADIEIHVQKTFPEPINEWAVTEAQEIAVKGFNKRNRDKPVLPWREVQATLKEKFNYKLDNQVTMYLVSVLEYIAADILKLTGNYVKNIRHTEITFQDLKVAMRADSVLMEMFFRDDDDVASSSSSSNNINYGSLSNVQDDYGNKVRVSLSYEDTVKDLLHDETQYLRDVNMIVLVFQNAFEKIVNEMGSSADKVDLYQIFDGISDVREFTMKFLSLLEETVEMTQEGAVPLIGSCYAEMAQAHEFDVYLDYIERILNPDCVEHLIFCLNTPYVREHLDLNQVGLRLAAKYVLPKLLLIPIFHCSKYFEYLSSLTNLSQSKNDKTDLIDSESLLLAVKKRLELQSVNIIRKNFPNQFLQLRLSGHNQIAIAKIQELSKTVDGWDSKIDEGPLTKLNTLPPKLANSLLGPSDTLRTSRNRTTERHVFLFDNLIVLCKAQTRRTASSAGANETKFKLKEYFQIRRVEVAECDDFDDLKHAFELIPKDNQPPIVLFAKSLEDKNTWMACLVLLQTRSILERKLNASLDEEENRIPLLLPSVEQYRFAERDIEDVNIKFENYSSSSGLPVVKAATLVKLIERLTHHQHVDPNFTKMFLMTYRSFCEPKQLLQLLVERFEIKDPTAFDDANQFVASVLSNGTSTTESIGSNIPSSPLGDVDILMKEALKKFRKKYAQPIQIKVLNVMRQWFDHHWYDFEHDKSLLESFKNFLESIQFQKAIRKWVKNILEIIARKEEAVNNGEDTKSNNQIFNSEPPPLEWHIATLPDQYDLMTLHPVEIARQVTLLEFDLYRAVKPIELVDAAWTKKDKSRSPQLTKLMKHSTNFTYWLQKCVLESANIEERVAVMNRILEILTVFDEMNNFNGLIEIHGVMQSSPVFRLAHTMEKLDKGLLKKYSEVEQLLDDRRHGKIRLKLKSINPPCVPFFGTYLTYLTSVNEATKFFAPNHTLPLSTHVSDAAEGPDATSTTNKLITVVNCRKTAAIISEIQLYQDQPYCLRVEPSIRHFFESLNPLEDFNDNPNDFQTYLYERSLVIEPKFVDRPPQFAAKRDPSCLKSPGIKHQKANMKQKSFGAPPPTPLLTPLNNYGREKHHMPPLTTSTAPGSPTSKDSPFAVIEIEQGKPPRYIGDVPIHSSRDMFTPSPSGSMTLPRTRTSSNPPSMGTAAVPPIPPRHATLSRAPKQNSSFEMSPPLPPKPGEVSQKLISPRSPLSMYNGNSASSHVDAGSAFRFPELPPGGPGRPVSKSPPTLNGSQQQHVAPLRGQVGYAPEIPPRRPTRTPLPSCVGVNSTGAAALPPPPLSPRRAVSPPTSLLESSSPLLVRVENCVNGFDASGSSSPPPPLPPRAKLTSPPPRPPKRGSINSPAPPPLPPKTYKPKRNFDDSENDDMLA